MITIFNRRELVMTYDTGIQSKVRDILAANNIDYTINPIMFSARMFTASEYKIYVKKSDYERASYLIRDVFR